MTASPYRPPGIVVGIGIEARIVAARTARKNADPMPTVCCAFGNLSQVAALVDSGVPALISFGLAGGLDPSLPPGTLILADSVIMPNGEILETHRVWRERVRMKLASVLAPVVAPVAGSDEVIADPGGKASLRRRTTAAAVDTESHAAARAAHRAGLMLLVLRAIADPASGCVPHAARRAVAPGGSLRPIAALSSAALSPSQIPELFRLARDTRAGLTNLRRAVDILGPRFGFDEMSAF